MSTAEHTTTVALSDIQTYVVNLKRRPDRKLHMQRQLPAALNATFTSDWTGPFDGHTLDHRALKEAGYQLFPWRIPSSNPWWNRPLKYGEIGCTLAHLAVWRAAIAQSTEFTLILEDDVILTSDFCNKLTTALSSPPRPFDLLYLGRFPLEPDLPLAPGFVVPGYSHCTFGYVLTHQGLTRVLAQHIEHAIVPVDEFLPAMYIDHPRADLRHRFPKQLQALALQPPIVRQLPKGEAGSDTEDSNFVTGSD